jgi:hypothetical protein
MNPPVRACAIEGEPVSPQHDRVLGLRRRTRMLPYVFADARMFPCGPRSIGEAAPDIVVTGESYVLLDLLDAILDCRGRGETLRTAFERARREGALDSVPSLVYLADGATLHEPRCPAWGAVHSLRRDL